MALIWMFTVEYAFKIRDQGLQHIDFDFQLFAIVFSVFDYDSHNKILKYEEMRDHSGALQRARGMAFLVQRV